MTRLAWLIIFMLLYLSSFSQTLHLELTITDVIQNPIKGASVLLIFKTDSTKIIYGISDNDGKCKLEVRAGEYQMRVNTLGYKQQEQQLLIKESSKNFTIMMKESVYLLDNITISAQKSLMEQDDDKTIINPEQLAISSSSGYEVLEKIPGVIIDQNGKVYTGSTSPATIYINGRQQNIDPSELASLLKSLPPSSIERIEIIRTPSSKYEASGAGGILNIVLKKGFKIGMIRNVNAGMNKGRYENNFLGADLNTSNARRSFHFNMNYSKRNFYEKIETTRKFSQDSVLNQSTYNIFPTKTFFSGYGYGTQSGQKWEFSIDGTFSIEKNHNSTKNQNKIQKSNFIDSFRETIDSIKNTSTLAIINQGINVKYKIDTLGSELVSDISYNNILAYRGQSFSTRYFNPDDYISEGADIKSGKEQLSIKLDLTYKHRKITIETGAKSTWSNYISDATFFDSQQKIDPLRTNVYLYKDNINSLYVQSTKKLRWVTVKVGTRIEQTYMNGYEKKPVDSTYTVSLINLFPYLFISKNIIKIFGYQLRGYLIQRSSITRPSYDNLNPYLRVTNQYFYTIGNPGLKPQLTQNFELNISVDERPIFAIGRNYHRDFITSILYWQDQNYLYQTYDNIDKSEETYLRLLGAIPPTGAYFFVIGAQFNYNNYEGVLRGNDFKFSRGSWTLFTFHQWKVDKNSTITVNGFYRFKGQLQFYELGNFGNINLSINRYFFKGKLLATLTATDPLFINNYTLTIQQGPIRVESFRSTDTRRIGINLKYNFGSKKKEDKIKTLNFDNFDNQ